MPSLLLARASFKEVEMETIFYFEYWIISGVSLPKFVNMHVHGGVVVYYKEATRRGWN